MKKRKKHVLSEDIYFARVYEEEKEEEEDREEASNSCLYG